MVKLDLKKARECGRNRALSLKATSPSISVSEDALIRISEDECITAAELESYGDLSFHWEEDWSGGVERFIDDIQACVVRIEAGYKDDLYIQISRTCLASERLKSDDKDWDSFKESNFWEKLPKYRPHEKDRSEVLRIALQRTVTGYSRRGLQRASKIFCALNPLLLKGVNPREIPEVIRSGGGIEKLAASHARPRSTNVRGISSSSDSRSLRTRSGDNHNLVNWVGPAAEEILDRPVSTRLRLLVEIGEPSQDVPTLLVHDVEHMQHD